MTGSERAERVHYHEYVTCEGIREHAERIVALEELVRDALAVIDDNCAACAWQDECELHLEFRCMAEDTLRERARGLGIEVK